MNDNGSRSPVPAIPLRRGEVFVREIAALRRRAQGKGEGTLAYFLEYAEIEARHLAEQEQRVDLHRESGELFP